MNREQMTVVLLSVGRVRGWAAVFADAFDSMPAMKLAKLLSARPPAATDGDVTTLDDLADTLSQEEQPRTRAELVAELLGGMDERAARLLLDELPLYAVRSCCREEQRRQDASERRQAIIRYLDRPDAENIVLRAEAAGLKSLHEICRFAGV